MTAAFAFGFGMISASLSLFTIYHAVKTAIDDDHDLIFIVCYPIFLLGVSVWSTDVSVLLFRTAFQ